MRAFPIRSPNFVCHCTTPCLYQPIKKKVSPYLSRFSNYACYKFVTSYGRTHARTDARTHGRTDELLDHNTSSRPKGPRAKKYSQIAFLNLKNENQHRNFRNIQKVMGPRMGASQIWALIVGAKEIFTVFDPFGCQFIMIFVSNQL